MLHRFSNGNCMRVWTETFSHLIQKFYWKCHKFVKLKLTLLVHAHSISTSCLFFGVLFFFPFFPFHSVCFLTLFLFQFSLGSCRQLYNYHKLCEENSARFYCIRSCLVSCSLETSIKFKFCTVFKKACRWQVIHLNSFKMHPTIVSSIPHT